MATMCDFQRSLPSQSSASSVCAMVSNVVPDLVTETTEVELGLRREIVDFHSMGSGFSMKWKRNAAFGTSLEANSAG